MTTVPSAPALLAAEGLSMRFGGLHALSEVSFTIASGELTALIGPNGAGKTTLLSCLSGELTPTAGRVLVRGAALPPGRPACATARGLARTFQAAEPFAGLSVRENVMVGGVPGVRTGLAACLAGLGPAQRANAALREAADVHLAAVGLLDRAETPAILLGAGQRRLLSIARILATGAEMLILDEPGAGLNDREKEHLGDVILSLSAAGKTILFVEHDMPLVNRVARRLLVLDRGRLIAAGAPETVRRDPAVIAAYLGSGAPRPSRIAVAPAAAPARIDRPMLEVRDLSLDYGGLQALDRISLDVAEGEIVAIVGANGAGKSSLLRTLVRAEAGRAGTLALQGEDLRAARVDQAVARGVSLVPERRALFPSLTVAENLASGRYARRRARGFAHLLWRSAAERAESDARLALVYDLFPILKERAGQLAGTLSGGQGQMLAIGRALMGEPRLLMLDEPSLGLAPQVVDEIMACLDRLRGQGMTILLVEQTVAAALAIADRGYVLAGGRIVASGTGAVLARDETIAGAYLGSPAADEASGTGRPALAAGGRA